MASPQYRRGFKVHAERVAAELRAELRLRPSDRLDPYALAEHLCVPVRTLHDFVNEAPEDVTHLLGAGRKVFSAVTIYVSVSKRLIVTNPSHAATRQMNSLCHEISHILLEHEPELPQATGRERDWNVLQEREADWLAGCLLIPVDAARAAARANQADGHVANVYGVSPELAGWRMNASGARIYAARRAAFR